MEISNITSQVEKTITDYKEKINTEYLVEEIIQIKETSKKILEKNPLSDFIDHTLLKPETSCTEVHKLCEEAITYNFKSVCVNSSLVSLASKLLLNKKTIPITVVGFPLGATLSEVKAFETSQSIKNGACEIDMVLNIGFLKSKKYQFVFDDIKAVVQAAKDSPVKVILETSILSKEEIMAACIISKAAGALFVKTSTGFSKGGAKEDDILLMRLIVGPNMGVKASGGIRSKKDALKMIASGANRIGASCSVDIIKDKQSISEY